MANHTPIRSQPHRRFPPAVGDGVTLKIDQPLTVQEGLGVPLHKPLLLLSSDINYFNSWSSHFNSDTSHHGSLCFRDLGSSNSLRSRLQLPRFGVHSTFPSR